MISNTPENVAVHPLVLLSVVDHFNRVVQKNRNRRVVGVLLGEWNKGTLDVTNCYALPFEEDPKEPHIWFVDHLYHEIMYGMFKKINAKEKIVGWYTTGSRFKQHDIEINELFRKYCSNPILVIIDVEHIDELALPTEAYCTVDEVKADGKIEKNFVHIPSTVEAFEPEEVGVEHLLREIKDTSLNSLNHNVHQKINSLKGLISKMKLIQKYLEKVLNSSLPPKSEVIFLLQEIFNLLPNLNSDEFIKAYSVKNNDMMFVLYICSIIRSTIALHNLINNKLQIKEIEKGTGDKEKTAPPAPAGEKSDKKAGEKSEKKESSTKK